MAVTFDEVDPATLPRLLEGTVVVDFTTGITGPYATMYLADQGATVVKVENTGSGGDAYRANPGFQTLNRGKFGVAAQLGRLDGPPDTGEITPDAPLLLALLRAADVVVTDVDRDEAEALGIDYASIHSHNPDAFYVSIPPWGYSPQDAGPLAGLPASASLVAATAGVMSTQISASGEPMHHRLPLAAYGTAIQAALATVAALRGRAAHGVIATPGQRIEVSELAGALSLVHSADREMLNQHPMGACGPIAPYRCYRAGDGKWFFLACANETFFKRMLAAVGLPELADHPDAADAWVFTNQAPAPRELLVPRLEAAFDSKPRSHWISVLQAADVPVAPIQSRDEFFASDFVKENKMRVEVDHPLHGRVSMMGVPIKLTACPGRVLRRAPLYGEHTATVLDLLRESHGASVAGGAGAGGAAGAGAGAAGSGRSSAAGDEDVPPPAAAVLDAASATASPFRVAPGASAAASTVPFLHGVRVLDLSSYIAGPLGPRHLAALGADVIKVESPYGDPFRSHLGFPDFNQGKRSVCVDLKKDEGRQAFYKMVAHADVVVENFRPSVTKRLGVDYDTLSKINPRLVYLSSPGFGAYAAMANRPAFDPLLQAMSGAMLAQGGGRAPVLHTIPLNDAFTAGLGAVGVACALLHVAKTGQGQRVHVSLTKSSVAIQAIEFTRCEHFKPEHSAAAGGSGSACDDGDGKASEDGSSSDDVSDGLAPTAEFLAGPSLSQRVFRVKSAPSAGDDEAAPASSQAAKLLACLPKGCQHLFVEAVTPEQRRAFLRVVVPDGDVSGADACGSDTAVADAVATAFASRSLSYWLSALLAAGVPCMPVTPCNGHWTHPAFTSIGLVTPQLLPSEATHQPRLGDLIRTSATHHERGHRAPRFAEHTKEVMTALGYSMADIDRLAECGAIRVEA